MATPLEDADDPVERRLHFPCGAEMVTAADRGEPIEEHTCPECGESVVPDAFEREPSERFRRSQERIKHISAKEDDARRLLPSDDALPAGWEASAYHSGGGCITVEFLKESENVYARSMVGNHGFLFARYETDEYGTKVPAAELRVDENGTYDTDADTVDAMIRAIDAYEIGVL